MGHEDVDRIAALIKRVVGEPHRADGRAQPDGRRLRSRDRITVLARGEVLAEGDYATVSKDPRVIEAYIGPAWLRRRRGKLWAPRGRAAPRGARACRPGTANRTSCTASTSTSRAGRGGDAARAQRRRQDHDPEVDHGHRGQAPAARSVRRRRDRSGCRRRAIARLGHRLLPGGARHLRQPDRRGEPPAAAAGQARRALDRPDLRALPEPARAAARARAPSCRAASSRCSPSAASCAPARVSCCSTSRPRGWRR